MLQESNHRRNCNRLKIIQTIPDQNTGKALHQGTTENSHTGNRTHTHTHTAESSDVKRNTFNMGSNITCHTNCNHRTAATIYTEWPIKMYTNFDMKNVTL